MEHDWYVSSISVFVTQYPTKYLSSIVQNKPSFHSKITIFRFNSTIRRNNICSSSVLSPRRRIIKFPSLPRRVSFYEGKGQEASLLWWLCNGRLINSVWSQVAIICDWFTIEEDANKKSIYWTIFDGTETLIGAHHHPSIQCLLLSALIERRVPLRIVVLSG